ncbi:competence protein ComGC [Loigolactobacillus backii]|nr:competence type IV pilus major pilin ComGC [Loigolactobacillus backii]PIO84407.1 competence protein ComGC [Loigolactobacillus backii]
MGRRVSLRDSFVQIKKLIASFNHQVLKKSKRAFTLIEMVVVLFIITLLIMIVLPNVGAQRKNAESTSDVAFKTVVQTQRDLYANDHDNKRASLDELKEAGYLSEKQLTKAKALEAKEK